MTLSFIRQDSSDVYFRDIDVSLPDSVKYDIIDNKEIIGMLITSDKQSFGKFHDGQMHYRKNQGFSIKGRLVKTVTEGLTGQLKSQTL